MRAIFAAAPRVYHADADTYRQPRGRSPCSPPLCRTRDTSRHRRTTSLIDSRRRVSHERPTTTNNNSRELLQRGFSGGGMNALAPWVTVTMTVIMTPDGARTQLQSPACLLPRLQPALIVSLCCKLGVWCRQIHYAPS
jgi:hypothetical protein